MWHLKKKILPNKNDQPTAKMDQKGNLISDKKSLLKLYKDEYIRRLTPKPLLSQYEKCQKLKDNLFNMRLEIASYIKSDNWIINDVLKVCKRLKNGKSRDEDGLIYELFNPSIAGHDLFKSLSLLFNKIKGQFIVPDFMQAMTITSFYKKCGSRSDMSS